MNDLIDHSGYARLSTDAVPSAEAFEYWRDMICATFVRLSADTVRPTDFSGQIEHSAIGSLELSTVTASDQNVHRTSRLISVESEEYVLASLQLRGRGRIIQDDRIADIGPGEMAFYDSTRAYTLSFDRPFEQLVVQVPREQLGVFDTRRLTARTLGSGTPGPVVAEFFRSLAKESALATDTTVPGLTDSHRRTIPALPVLHPHALGLLGAAANFAHGRALPEANLDGLVREQALTFMRSHLADPRIDAEAIARACNVSRRTLYRAIGDGGVFRRLRELRIGHACTQLIAHPGRAIAAIAAESGFATESGFHRAFRTARGMSPAEYRARHALVRD